MTVIYQVVSITLGTWEYILYQWAKDITEDQLDVMWELCNWNFQSFFFSRTAEIFWTGSVLALHWFPYLRAQSFPPGGLYCNCISTEKLDRIVLNVLKSWIGFSTDITEKLDRITPEVASGYRLLLHCYLDSNTGLFLKKENIWGTIVSSWS